MTFLHRTRSLILLFGLILVFMPWLVCADNAPELHRVLRDGSWGFINARGEVVVPIQYDYVYRYSNGFTVVIQGDYETGKRAFLNAAGEEITGFVFDWAFHFVSGFGTAQLGGKWGFIAPDGTPVGEFRWDRVRDFVDGHAQVRIGSWADGKWGLIDTDGREVLPVEFGTISYAGEGAWWVGIDRNRRALFHPGASIPTQFPYLSSGTFTDGIAVVTVKSDSGTLWLLIDHEEAELFVSDTEIAGYSQGIMRLKAENGFLYRRIDGQYLPGGSYDSALDFRDGLARVGRGENWSGRLYGYINTDGAVIVEPRYSTISSFDQYGLARFKLDGQYGFISREGDIAVRPIWHQVGTFQDGLCPVMRGDRWGFIDTSGQLVIPLRYEQAYDFSEGWAVVREGDYENGLRSYVDTSGNVMSANRYQWAFSFDGSLAHVAEGDYETGSFGYIDMSGNYVWEPEN